ncbi:MAG TPA: sensor histidine kinase, partial [Mycobacteriales bacterium]|nr:sensor histidine kinase [Mycobacteriales bacterium]
MSVFGRPRGLRRDALLAAAIAAVQVGATAAASTHQAHRRPLDALAVALLVGSAAALTARSRHPVAVLWTTFVLTGAYWALNYPGGPVFLAMIVALVTVVRTGRRLVAWTSLAVGYVTFGWVAPALAGDPAPTLAGALGTAAWLLLIGTGAEVFRARREH